MHESFNKISKIFNTPRGKQGIIFGAFALTGLFFLYAAPEEGKALATFLTVGGAVASYLNLRHLDI